MRKSIIAPAFAAAVWLCCPAAEAATRFDIIFTAETSSLPWVDKAPANGTGFVLVEGYTGLGTELFAGGGGLFPIVDFKVELASAIFDASVTQGGYPKLTVKDGVATNFELYGYRFSPSTQLFSPLRPGVYQLVTSEATFTGSYSIKRYEPPPPPLKDGPTGPVASPVPEPSTWVTLIVGFFGLGAMLRLARRRRAAVV